MNINTLETFEFAGIKTSKANKISYKKVFDEVYNDDGMATFITKERFLYPSGPEETLPKFEYQYMIRVIDMGSIEASETDSNIIHVVLLMVPCVEYVNPKHVESFGEDLVSTSDLFDYVALPLISNESFEYSISEIDDPWNDYYYDPTENKTVADKLDCIATILPCINGMLGFYMDKYQNRLDSTGWDYLEDIILGKDFVHSALKRINF